MTELVPLADRVTDREAARYLGVSPGTLRNWRSQGRGPAYYQVLRRVFYVRRDLDRFLLRCRIDPHGLSFGVTPGNGAESADSVNLAHTVNVRRR